MPATKIVDELAAMRLLEKVAKQAHKDAKGGGDIPCSLEERQQARAWLAEMQGTTIDSVKLARPRRTMTRQGVK